MVRRVALTGGIATGKSTVAGYLREWGVPVVDADQLARDAVAPGTPALDEIVRRFGSRALTARGELDRTAVADLVFGDAGARRDLESMIHPVVRAGIDAFYARLSGDTAGVTEIPLVYETGRQTDFDTVVVAACREDTQRRRLVERDALSLRAIADRLASQWPVEDKARVADFVIMTEGSIADTERQAWRMAEWLRAGDRLRVVGPWPRPLRDRSSPCPERCVPRRNCSIRDNEGIATAAPCSDSGT